MLPKITEEIIARQAPEAQAIIRGLLARIAELEAQVEELRARIEELQRQGKGNARERLAGAVQSRLANEPAPSLFPGV